MSIPENFAPRDWWKVDPLERVHQRKKFSLRELALFGAVIGLVVWVFV